MDFKDPYKEWLDYNGSRNTTPDELITESISARTLKPGHIYRFKYRDEEEMRKMIRRESKSPYYDTHPTILSLGLDEKAMYEIGINLNTIPYQTKYKLLYVIYGKMEKYFINELSQPYATWKSWPMNEKNINQIYKLPSKVSINKYTRHFMRDVEAVDWGSAIKLATFYEKDSLLLNKAQNMTIVKLFKMSH